MTQQHPLASAGDGRRRLALLVQYDGSAYHGWQRQQNGTTVQATLEQAVGLLDPGFSGSVVAAGRTDSGVHAAGQVVHLDVCSPVPVERWPKALNGRLPADIRVLAARCMADHWHACFQARSRLYRYRIYNGVHPDLFLRAYSWHRYATRLDEVRMAAALQPLLGYHDFGAFRRAGSRRSHSCTTVQAVQVVRTDDVVTVDVQCSGFLYGMMRLLLGQLVAVGEGRLGLDAFERRWRSGCRQDVKEAAPPLGLCLLKVAYADEIFPPHTARPSPVWQIPGDRMVR